MNSFYASVEMLHHLEFAGMALWQAKQVCPDITFLPPRMDLYLRFSRMAQEIYADYTDKREPYGIDES